MYETFFRWFTAIGINDVTAVWLARYGGIALAILIAVALYFAVRKLLLKWITALSERSKTHWDDALLHHRVLSRTAVLLPLLTIDYFNTIVLDPALYTTWILLIDDTLNVLYAIQITLIFSGLLNAAREIAHEYPITRNLPIDSVVQLLKVVLYFLGGVVVISYLMGQTPVYLLGSLGAITAVLSFIYQDALRGLVAGIQLTANNLLSKGDIIEMPSYGVSGSVMEVGLTTVKIQNFDYSITTVPTYALITDSFKNWRGMSQADGRRIVRTVILDVNSVKFCDDALLDKLRGVTLLASYIDERQAEIDRYNETHQIDQTEPINGRRQTNFGLFRAYLVAYLNHHSTINQEMDLMIRQLEATTQGIGLQVYAFSRDKTWVGYEGVMADIFDHILAAVPTFELQIYQAPSGHDIQALKG